jgi:hypothetical protein
MLSVKVAAAWVGLILSSVTVQAMSVQGHEQLLPPGSALFILSTGPSADHARPLPLGTPLFVANAVIRFVDADQARPLPPGTPLFKSASPAISFAHQARPLPLGTPLFVTRIAAPTFELAERPLPPGTPLFSSAVTSSPLAVQAQPLPPGTPLFVSTVSTVTVDLADRDQPLPPGSPLFSHPIEPQRAAIRQGTVQARAEAIRPAFAPTRL